MKILKFGAIWCSGCLVMKPRWVEIEKENPWLSTKYFDADENENLLQEYKITDLPCFVFLDKDNKEVHREVGEIDKQKLVKLINEYKDK